MGKLGKSFKRPSNLSLTHVFIYSDNKLNYVVGSSFTDDQEDDIMECLR